ncbi:hypothetical protein REPUB_Repub13aG0028900 [Reevesia pubescens]
MGSQKRGFLLLSGLLFLNILLFSSADIHHYEFVLQESEFRKLCNTKSILTVNGSFPGPEIRVRRGDTVFVNVYNQGNYAVSIEWDGVEDSIDGSDNLIQPGRNFTYEMELDDEIGTLWWHANSAWASATVHGAFVILPAIDEQYPFPAPTSDQTIILGMIINLCSHISSISVYTFYLFDSYITILWHILVSGPWFLQEINEPGQANAYTINGYPGETYGCNNGTYAALFVNLHA